MTREEAKRRMEICRDFLANNYSDMGEPNFTAFNMAIQALSQEPCETIHGSTYGGVSWGGAYKPQEPCDDAISRDAVLDGLKGCICEEWIKTLFATMVKQLPSVTQKSAKDYLDMADRKAKKIKDALTVTQKSGKWIEMDGYDGDVYYDCSECGESWTTIEGTPWDNGMKYCPNCGVKMVEPQESEDKE